MVYRQLLIKIYEIAVCRDVYVCVVCVKAFMSHDQNIINGVSCMILN